MSPLMLLVLEPDDLAGGEEALAMGLAVCTPVSGFFIHMSLYTFLPNWRDFDVLNAFLGLYRSINSSCCCGYSILLVKAAVR